MNLFMHKDNWNNEKYVFHYITLTNQLSFEINFQKVYQHTEGKWLIHGTKDRWDYDEEIMTKVTDSNTRITQSP